MAAAPPRPFATAGVLGEASAQTREMDAKHSKQLRLAKTRAAAAEARAASFETAQSDAARATVRAVLDRRLRPASA